MLTCCGVVREVAGIWLDSGELTHDGCMEWRVGEDAFNSFVGHGAE